MDWHIERCVRLCRGGLIFILLCIPFAPQKAKAGPPFAWQTYVVEKTVEYCGDTAWHSVNGLNMHVYESSNLGNHFTFVGAENNEATLMIVCAKIDYRTRITITATATTPNRAAEYVSILVDRIR